MHFKISSMAKANKRIKAFEATHLISINDPPQRTFQNRLQPDKHLTVHFEDTEFYDEPSAPTLAHIEYILAFGATIPENETVVVNCHAGMCRSTAVALGLAVQRYGLEKLPEAAAAMIEQRPQSCPNRLVAHLMDVALGTNGEIFKIACDISDRYMIKTHLITFDQGYLLPPRAE